MTALQRTLGLFALLAAACSSSSNDFETEPVPVFSDHYEDCDFDDDCPLDNLCYEIAVDYGASVVIGNMCTNECFDDFDCIQPGICVGASSGPPLCYQTCFDDFDCFAGFICVAEYGPFSVPTCQPG